LFFVCLLFWLTISDERLVTAIESFSLTTTLACQSRLVTKFGLLEFCNNQQMSEFFLGTQIIKLLLLSTLASLHSTDTYHAQIYTHTYTNTDTDTRKHTDTGTHTDTHMHTHKHTHTHTHDGHFYFLACHAWFCVVFCLPLFHFPSSKLDCNSWSDHCNIGSVTC
jgi:hypothetical protein